METAQILLLDANLQILFSQEREKLATYFQDLRELISRSLHHNYSHLIPLKDDEGYTLAYKSLESFPTVILVLICKTSDNDPAFAFNLIRLNALLDDCCSALSAFYSSIGTPDWIFEIERLHDIFNELIF